MTVNTDLISWYANVLCRQVITVAPFTTCYFTFFFLFCHLAKWSQLQNAVISYVKEVWNKCYLKSHVDLKTVWFNFSFFQTHVAVPETAVLQTVANLDTLIAVIECQQPEADLYRYGVIITILILSSVYRFRFYNDKRALS